MRSTKEGPARGPARRYDCGHRLLPLRRPRVLRFDDIHGKMSGAFDIFNNYNLRLDVATFALVGLAYLWAYLGHKIQINRRMIVPLLVLLLIYAAMPNRIIGTYGADRRLVIALALAVVARQRETHCCCFTRSC